MKIKMLVDSRIFFTKGSEIEVNEGEAKRLLSLGFAENAEKKTATEVKAEKPKRTKKED
jgi:Fe2+ transport system protein FeoA